MKNKASLNTADRNLLSLCRRSVSSYVFDYADAVEAYMKLSAAEIGFPFLKTGELSGSNDRTFV